MGESTRDRDTANDATSEFLRVVAGIQEHQLNASVSLELSPVGLVVMICGVCRRPCPRAEAQSIFSGSLAPQKDIRGGSMYGKTTQEYLALACLLAVFASTVGACSSLGGSDTEAPDPVVLTTDQRSYTAGDPLTLELINRSDQTYQAGELCKARLERQDQADWETVSPPFAEPRVCEDILLLYKPSASKTLRTRLPGELLAGTYRYVFELSSREASHEIKPVTVTTQPFAVRQP